MVLWSELARQHAVVKEVKPIPTLWERAAKLSPSPLTNGHQIMDCFRQYLSKFDTDTKQRSYDQIRMQEFFLAACTRNIYGAAYDMHQIEIMEYNHFERLFPYVGVCTPRRWGKSWALGIFVAAYALAVPDCVIAIYAPGGRAAGAQDGMLSIIKKMLIDVHGMTDSQFTTKDKEHLYFKVNGNLRQIKAFPGGKNSFVFLFFCLLFIFAYCCEPIVSFPCKKDSTTF